MKTTTLKLTNSEWNFLYNNVHSDRCFMGITLPLDDEFGCFVNVHNIDRFKVSLNDEIKDVKGSLFRIKKGDFANLKSIMSKLN